MDKSEGAWVETGAPHHCLKYVGCRNDIPVGFDPRIWLWLTQRTYQVWGEPGPYGVKGGMWGPETPWPEGLTLEEVKAYTVTLWRLTR